MRSQQLHYALGTLILLAGCRQVDPSEYESYRDHLDNWRNRVDYNLVESERRLTALEGRLTAAETRAEEVRMGIVNQLQAVQRQTAQGITNATSSSETQDQMILDQVGNVHNDVVIQVDRLNGRIDEGSRRLALLERRELSLSGDVAPIGTLATGRAYLGVVLLSNGQIDPRGLQQPRAYLDQSAIATAIARGYLDPGIIEMLNSHATALSPFPATSTPADLRTTSPLLDPVASTPNQARELVGQMALEGLLCDPSGRPLHVRDVDVIIPSEARAVYLFQRRDLYNSPPAPRPE